MNIVNLIGRGNIVLKSSICHCTHLLKNLKLKKKLRTKKNKTKSSICDTENYFQM